MSSSSSSSSKRVRHAPCGLCLGLHQGVHLVALLHLLLHLLLLRKQPVLLQRHPLHPLQRLHLLPQLPRTRPNKTTPCEGWAHMALLSAPTARGHRKGNELAHLEHGLVWRERKSTARIDRHAWNRLLLLLHVSSIRAHSQARARGHAASGP